MTKLRVAVPKLLATLVFAAAVLSLSSQGMCLEFDLESDDLPSPKLIIGDISLDPIFSGVIRDRVTNSVEPFTAVIDLNARTVTFSYSLVGGDGSIVWSQGVISLNTLSGPGMTKTLIGSGVSTRSDFFRLHP